MTKYTHKDSATFCVMPHLSLAMQNEGDVCVCNKNTASLKDKFHNKIYLHEHGLEAAWNSPYRKMIAAGLDHGRKLPGCQQCWDDENAGKESSRQKFNAIFGDIEPEPTQPKILIIKPGNTCNLGCRTCQPSTSSSLYQDFYKLDTQRKTFDGTFKEYTKSFETIRHGFNKENKLVWEPYEKWLPKLEFLDIYGGEPLLSPPTWQGLKNATKDNSSKNVSIQFHTNATIWNDGYMSVLQHYKSVSIGISIDSHKKEQLEYIRHGSDSDEILKNLVKYKELAKKYPNIKPMVTCTVSIYNIFDLPEIYAGLQKYGFPIGINLVHSPSHYDIRRLPRPLKTILIEKIGEMPQFVSVKKVLEHTIPGCDIEWPKFCEEIELLDSIRKQSFAQAFPEWHSLLKDYIERRSLW